MVGLSAVLSSTRLVRALCALCRRHRAIILIQLTVIYAVVLVVVVQSYVIIGVTNDPQEVAVFVSFTVLVTAFIAPCTVNI